MGITIAGWQHNLLESLLKKGIAADVYAEGNALLLKFMDARQLVLNLISSADHMPVEDMLNLQLAYRANGVLLVQLWEDIWITRPMQVLSRINSILGKNSTVHGRKTKVVALSQPEADSFFDRYHLQASASSRYKYALTLDNEVVAMASFSARRNMTRREKAGYTSVELIRFATKDGITVQGGLSKLIRHLIKTIAPDDVMTYADMDWSYGQGYTRLGFELVSASAPAEIWLNTENMTRVFPHRLPPEIRSAISGMSSAEADVYLAAKHYLRVYNTGNLKYILKT